MRKIFCILAAAICLVGCNLEEEMPGGATNEILLEVTPTELHFYGVEYDAQNS